MMSERRAAKTAPQRRAFDGPSMRNDQLEQAETLTAAETRALLHAYYGQHDSTEALSAV